MIHHRSPDFAAVFDLAQARLREVFRTENEVLVFDVVGHGRVRVRGRQPPLARRARARGLAGGVRRALAGDGARVRLRRRPARVRRGATSPAPGRPRARRSPRAARATAFIVHSETSTGVVCDLEPLLAVCREAGALSVVDAISSLGAVPLETDAWGADVVVTGSQKALMTPPGLAFAAVSDAGVGAHGDGDAAALLLGLGAPAPRPGEED